MNKSSTISLSITIYCLLDKTWVTCLSRKAVTILHEAEQMFILLKDELKFVLWARMFILAHFVFINSNFEILKFQESVSTTKQDVKNKIDSRRYLNVNKINFSFCPSKNILENITLI